MLRHQVWAVGPVNIDQVIEVLDELGPDQLRRWPRAERVDRALCS